MKNLIPPKLQPGDVVGIVTPASQPYGEKRERYEKGIAYLREQGYEVVEGHNARAERGYLAGTDEQRAADLNDMFSNPEVKGIFCTRGGYGTLRLLDRIDYEAIRRNPKIFVGYSDITTLQLAIYQQTGLVTFSGPMVAVEMGKGIDKFTEHNLWRMITDEQPLGEFPMPSGQQLKTYRAGQAEGRLLGGCLSLITPLLGTKYMPDFNNAILVVEDIDEDTYRLDKHFAQLRLAGVLQKLSGIVFGQFIDCEPKGEDAPPFLTVEEVIADYIEGLNIPVVGKMPYGHGDVKVTLPIGAQVILDADSGKLLLSDAVVA